MRLLVQAELFRIWRRPFYLVPFAIGVLFAALPLIYFVLSRVNSENLPYLISYSGFPDGVYMVLQLAFLAMPTVLAALAAGIASEDYAAGTLKIALPRITSRANYLLAKHIAVILGCFVFLVSLFFAVSLTASLARLVAGLPILTGHLELGAFLGLLLLFLLKSLYVGVYSIFWVTLTRSQALGLVLALVTPLLITMMTFLPGGVFLPEIQLSVIEVELFPGTRFSVEELASVLGSQPSFPFALVSVVLFCIVISGISFALFQRRDVS